MPWHIPTLPSPKRKARARLRPCVLYSRWLGQHTSGTKAKKRRLYFNVVTSFNMFAHVAFAGTASANKAETLRERGVVLFGVVDWRNGADSLRASGFNFNRPRNGFYSFLNHF